MAAKQLAEEWTRALKGLENLANWNEASLAWLRNISQTSRGPVDEALRAMEWPYSNLAEEILSDRGGGPGELSEPSVQPHLQTPVTLTSLSHQDLVQSLKQSNFTMPVVEFVEKQGWTGENLRVAVHQSVDVIKALNHKQRKSLKRFVTNFAKPQTGDATDTKVADFWQELVLGRGPEKAEPEHFDFKSAPFSLKSSAKRVALAVDVASLYNTQHDSPLSSVTYPCRKASYLVVGYRPDRATGGGAVVPCVLPTEYQRDLSSHLISCLLMPSSVEIIARTIYLSKHDVDEYLGGLYGDRVTIYHQAGWQPPDETTFASQGVPVVLYEILHGSEGPLFVMDAKWRDVRLTRKPGTNLNSLDGHVPDPLWRCVLSRFTQHTFGAWHDIRMALKVVCALPPFWRVLVLPSSQGDLLSQQMAFIAAIQWDLVINLDVADGHNNLLAAFTDPECRPTKEIDRSTVGELRAVDIEAKVANGSLRIWFNANSRGTEKKVEKLNKVIGYVTNAFKLALFSSQTDARPAVFFTFVTGQPHYTSREIVQMSERLAETYENLLGERSLADVPVAAAVLVTERCQLSHFNAASEQLARSSTIKGCMVQQPLHFVIAGLTQMLGGTLPLGSVTIVGAILTPSNQRLFAQMGDVLHDGLGEDDVATLKALLAESEHSRAALNFDTAPEVVRSWLVSRHMEPFLRGGLPTWDLLAVQEFLVSERCAERLYVLAELSAFSRILGKVEERLRSADFLGSGDKVLELLHLPTSGGSTALRWVLWKLRKRFPCLLLTPPVRPSAVSGDVFERLADLYRLTSKVVVVGVDGGYSLELIRDLSDRLRFSSQRTSKVLFLHCRQVRRKSAIEKDKFSLEKLTMDDDCVRVRECYTFVKQQAKVTCLLDSLFLWGFETFSESYERTDSYLQAYLAGSHELFSLVRTICLLQAYAPTCYIPESDLARFHSDLVSFRSLEELVPHFFIKDAAGGVRLPASGMVDRVWPIVAGGQGTPLVDAVDDFINAFSGADENMELNFSRHFLWDSTRQLFQGSTGTAQLIVDYSAKHGRQCTLIKFGAIARGFGPYASMACAQYVFHERELSEHLPDIVDKVRIYGLDAVHAVTTEHGTSEHCQAEDRLFIMTQYSDVLRNMASTVRMDKRHLLEEAAYFYGKAIKAGVEVDEHVVFPLANLGLIEVRVQHMGILPTSEPAKDRDQLRDLVLHDLKRVADALDKGNFRNVQSMSTTRRRLTNANRRFVDELVRSSAVSEKDDRKAAWFVHNFAKKKCPTVDKLSLAYVLASQALNRDETKFRSAIIIQQECAGAHHMLSKLAADHVKEMQARDFWHLIELKILLAGHLYAAPDLQLTTQYWPPPAELTVESALKVANLWRQHLCTDGRLELLRFMLQLLVDLQQQELGGPLRISPYNRDFKYRLAKAATHIIMDRPGLAAIASLRALGQDPHKKGRRFNGTFQGAKVAVRELSGFSVPISKTNEFSRQYRDHAIGVTCALEFHYADGVRAVDLAEPK